MLEEQIGQAGDDYIEFHEAGTHAKGQYRCTSCGYGVTIHDELPDCPICAGTVWELSPWTPFGNAREELRQPRGALL